MSREDGPSDDEQLLGGGGQQVGLFENDLLRGYLHSDDLRWSFGATKGRPDRRPARIQDPCAARLQLTVRNLETAIDLYKTAGPSTVVSSRGEIITQPGYRVAVVSDLNGLFLVLTDRRVTR